jgi:hypothetical protein
MAEDGLYLIHLDIFNFDILILDVVSGLVLSFELMRCSQGFHGELL